MVADPLETSHVSMVGHHDLNERPGFKIDVQEVDGTWYLYTASFWEPGFSVLDVTDPSDPEFLTYVDGPDNTLTIQVQVADGIAITSMEKPRSGRGRVDRPEQDPEAPFDEGANIWDVETDPANPEHIGTYRTGGDGTHRNYYNGGDYAYMAAVPGGEYSGRLLEIVDVSDPTDPEPLSKWWWPGQGPGEDDPIPEYLVHGPIYPDEDENLAYSAWGSVGMVSLDVSEKTNPQFVDRLSFGDFGSKIQTHTANPLPGKDLVVVNSEALAEGLPMDDDGEPHGFTLVVDVSRIANSDDPANDEDAKARIISSFPYPTPEDGLPYHNYHEKPGRFGPHNQNHAKGLDVRYQTEDYLFMTWFNAGLRVFDISDPLRVEEAGYWVPGEPEKRIARPRPGSGLVGTLEDVVVDSRGYVYTTDPQQGLYVLETDLI